MPRRDDLDEPPGSGAGPVVPVGTTAATPVDEPPVVARMVIEIRSDGRRTIARGALEDVASGQRTAIEARGSTPVQLALELARVMVRLPRLVVGQVRRRGLLGRGPR
ncbi:MAG: hypothetical protein KBG28_19280 [Kofleriaceae bacterium]|jgi:hypothetical protein|nr:hypothetical protein [Kofleriaceae bacterium]